MINYLELKTWEDSHSSVWKEIVSRFGQSDYDDETKRTAHIATLKAEWEAKNYQRNRVTDYPPIGDQLDALYHGGVFPKEMTDILKAIKDKYPKG